MTAEPERPELGLILGGIFDPAMDTWTEISQVGAPALESAFSTVWTGQEMVVWGGQEVDIGLTNVGGRYRP
jgi:hypothetical protein